MNKYKVCFKRLSEAEESMTGFDIKFALLEVEIVEGADLLGLIARAFQKRFGPESELVYAETYFPPKEGGLNETAE